VDHRRLSLSSALSHGAAGLLSDHEHCYEFNEPQSCAVAVYGPVWIGVIGIFAGLVTVPAPLIAGLIWRYVGPAYIFVIPSALDLALRIPLLTAIPETLWRQEL